MGWTMKKILISTSLFFLAEAGAVAQSNNSEWLDELRSQLVMEQGCEAAFFLNLYENEGSLGLHQRARVQCEDGRMFDAERFSPNEDFKIDACDTQVCSDSVSRPGNAKS